MIRDFPNEKGPTTFSLLSYCGTEKVPQIPTVPAREGF